MNRRDLLNISAGLAFGLGLLSGDASAQQKTIKEQIVGTWLVTSVSDQYEDGKKENTFGAGVGGAFSFDGNRHFMWTMMGEKQTALKSDDPRRPDAFTVALFGTYKVEGSVISLHIERAANSVRDGADQTLTVSGTGDSLTFTGSSRKDQKGTFSPTIGVVRAK